MPHTLRQPEILQLSKEKVVLDRFLLELLETIRSSSSNSTVAVAHLERVL